MSTSTKDSRLKKCKPQLAAFYETATREVFGSFITVGKKHWEKFYKREEELQKVGILPRDYAFRLLKHLTWFVEGKGWKSLPVNIFLGKWAEGIYRREIGNRQFTYMRDDEDEQAVLIADEYKLVMYANDKNIPIRTAAKDLWPLMSVAWQQAYDNGNREQVSLEAIELYTGVVNGHVSPST